LGLMSSVFSFFLPFHILLSALLASVLTLGICVLSFVLLIKVRSQGVDLFKAFALDISIPWKTFTIWLVVSVAGVVFVEIFYQWICRHLGIKLYSQLVSKLLHLSDLKGLQMVAVFLLVAFIGPILEELTFRGILYQSLRTKAKPWLAILISSVFFAAVHLDISAFIPILVLGGVQAYAFEKTKSLRLPIAIHCLNNGLSIVLIMLSRG